jgi:hypothetical protein
MPPYQSPAPLPCTMTAGQALPDAVPYTGRLAAAVGFVRQNLPQGGWRISRAIRKLGVRAEDIARELDRLGFEPSPKGRAWRAKSSSSSPQSTERPSPVSSDPQSGKARAVKTRKPAQPPFIAYCPMCRDERQVKPYEGRTWGSCAICGAAVGIGRR